MAELASAAADAIRTAAIEEPDGPADDKAKALEAYAVEFTTAYRLAQSAPRLMSSKEGRKARPQQEKQQSEKRKEKGAAELQPQPKRRRKRKADGQGAGSDDEGEGPAKETPDEEEGGKAGKDKDLGTDDDGGNDADEEEGEEDEEDQPGAFLSVLKPPPVPPELDEVLLEMTRTGVPLYRWKMGVKELLAAKVVEAVNSCYDEKGWTGVGGEKGYIRQRAELIHSLSEYDAAPFTLQRLAEVLANPKRQYSATHKLVNGIAKLLSVSTTLPMQQRSEPMDESET